MVMHIIMVTGKLHFDVGFWKVHICLVFYFAERRKIIILLLILTTITFIILYHSAMTRKTVYKTSNNDASAVLLTNRYAEKDVNYDKPVKNLTDFQNLDFSNPHNSRPTYIEDILITLKTSHKFHRTRLQILYDTWISQALHSVSRKPTHTYTCSWSDRIVFWPIG